MSLILYLAGLLALCTGIFLIRKSNERQNAVIYLIFTAVIFMVIQSVEAAIINIIPIIKVDAATFGILHAIEGSVLWYFILVRRYRQKYFFEGADIIALMAVAVVVAVVAVRQFGIRLDNFNFKAESDGARHYMFARNVAIDGKLISLFFSSLNSGLIMNALRGIISDVSMYRIFIFYETYVLFLNGAVFWMLIRKYLNDKFLIIIGIVVTLVYMLGYPWNSMVMGTAYLSTGIMCVVMIIFLIDTFYDNVFCYNVCTIVLLGICCYALLHSYSLFVPPVLGGIFLIYVFKCEKMKRIDAHKTNIIVSAIIIIGFLAVIAFMYVWAAFGIKSEQLDALSLWGRIYGSLYADFLFVIPLCIYWILRSIKMKDKNTECTLLVVFLLYTAVLFAGNYIEKISAYYFYKTYYILWIVSFLAVMRTIVVLEKERLFLFSYAFTWIMLFAIYISSFEKMLPQQYNFNLAAASEGRTASDYFGLFNYNMMYSGEDTINKNTKELYMEAAKLSVQTGEFIPYVGKYMDNEWTYFAFAGLEHKNVLEGKNYNSAVQELKKYQYILSVECEESTVNVNEFLKTLPILYQNESGKIYKVNDNSIYVQDIEDNLSVDIISRYGLPSLNRMGWVEQDEYVNNLQVIDRIAKLEIDKEELLYPEVMYTEIENTLSSLKNSWSNKERIVFDGTTSEELQQTINNNPNTIIDVHSKIIELNDTIVLQNNTAINGNGVVFRGYGLEYAFFGENISNIYLNSVCMEGKINYGVYLIDCNDINILECRMNRLLQKSVCIIGDTKGLRIVGNEMCANNAGGLYLSGAVSYGLIEDNVITDNNGASKWMSGIVLTDIEPRNKFDIWEDFDKGHKYPLRDDIFAQVKCTHDIIIRGNNISDNRSKGIYSDGAYKCYVLGNTLTCNNNGNVSLEYGTIGFFVGENFLDTGIDACYPGISMNNTAYNILKNNIITDACVGIKLEHTSVRNLIMENVVHGVGNGMEQTYGIKIGAEAKEVKTEKIDYVPDYENIICRNSITGNYYSGIFIDTGCYINDVFDNVIMESQVYAIEAISDMFNSIVNNTSNAEIKILYHTN